MTPLLAVHIQDGVLTAPWLFAGFAIAGGLCWLGSRGLTEDQVPHVGLLTAAFFVASSLRVPIGPTSVHLLLNGLLGVILGRRVCLAIPIGLLLQCLLAGHGGLSALGVNSVVMTVPALVASWLFRRGRAITLPTSRFLLVVAGIALLVLGIEFAIELVQRFAVGTRDLKTVSFGDLWTFSPLGLGIALASGTIVASLWRGEATFALGVLLGGGSVLLTCALNVTVLVLGVEANLSALAIAVWAAHLPIAAIEGIVTGTLVVFIERVKPELFHVRDR